MHPNNVEDRRVRMVWYWYLTILPNTPYLIRSTPYSRTHGYYLASQHTPYSSLCTSSPIPRDSHYQYTTEYLHVYPYLWICTPRYMLNSTLEVKSTVPNLSSSTRWFHYFSQTRLAPNISGRSYHTEYWYYLPCLGSLNSDLDLNLQSRLSIWLGG